MDLSLKVGRGKNPATLCSRSSCRQGGGHGQLPCWLPPPPMPVPAPAPPHCSQFPSPTCDPKNPQVRKSPWSWECSRRWETPRDQLQSLADQTVPLLTPGSPQNSTAARPYPDIHDLGDLPEVNEDPNENADLDHKVGLIVQDVEEDHERLEDAKEDGAHRQALQGLPAVPELDICAREVGGAGKLS